MDEINRSTLLLIGLDDNKTRVITYDSDYLVDESARDIVNQSCINFGNTLMQRIKMTKSLVNISSKAPVLIEESRDIIFFPLKSPRLKNNIWVSFNNLNSYDKIDDKTSLNFKGNKTILLDFSYYIFDNQVTKAILLHYEIKKRRKSL